MWNSDLERQISEQTKTIGELEEKLKQSESEINNLCRENNEQSEKIGELESEINNLRRENTELNEKLTDFERQQKEMSSRLFCVDRFMTDGDISFYTGMSSYATFMAIFEYLNPGDNCENIRLRGSVTDVPKDFYNSDCDVWEEGSQKNIWPIFMVWLSLLYAEFLYHG